MKLVCMISLGCPKNLVDSEVILGILASAGYVVTPSPEDAEVILINTCGFIEPAVREATDTILNCVQLKRRGSCCLLIVLGCLTARYGAERLSRFFPDVDLWLGVNAAPSLLSCLEKLTGKKAVLPQNQQIEEYPRLLATPPYTAYLKIAEGCSHACSYCLIPSIRGPLKSRRPESIIREAAQLITSGVKEIILVAQDTGAYGRDLPDCPSLADLIKEICKLDNFYWLRLLYLNPSSLTSELIDVFQEEPKVCCYLDIPIQHVNQEILRNMGRRGDPAYYLQMVKDLRALLPGVALRTTLITGYPGEGPEAFQELLDFVAAAEWDRLGVFPYYHEEGTRSFKQRDTVSYITKRKRRRMILRLQRSISRRRNEALVGKELDVLIEGHIKDNIWWGRSYRDAPEIDSKVIVRGNNLCSGDFVRVRIGHASTFDLIGTVCS